MSTKRMTEQELLEGLDVHTSHADELAAPLLQELDGPEQLRGAVKRYERPFDGVWDEYFEGEGATNDCLEDRDQTDSEA